LLLNIPIIHSFHLIVTNSTVESNFKMQ